MKRCFLGLLLLTAAAAQPENPYSPDVAAQYLPVSAAVENIRDGVALEKVTPVAVLQTRSVPFQAVPLAPQKVSSALPKSWELPPFATIGPPQVNPEAPPQEPEQGPPVFSELPTHREAPSPLLRPKVGPHKIQSHFKDYVIPPAISRVCYGSNSAGICQFSLYGGTNSFVAEDAYIALTAALDSREELKGFGKEGVLGIYKDQVESPVGLSERRFESIAVTGKKRPDLIDPGLNKARQAPAFKSISTEPGVRGHLDLSKLPSPKPAEPPRAPRSYWVFLAYYPDKAVTAEIVLDQRLGNPQNLVQMGALIQTQLNERQ